MSISEAVTSIDVHNWHLSQAQLQLHHCFVVCDQAMLLPPELPDRPTAKPNTQISFSSVPQQTCRLAALRKPHLERYNQRKVYQARCKRASGLSCEGVPPWPLPGTTRPPYPVPLKLASCQQVQTSAAATLHARTLCCYLRKSPPSRGIRTAQVYKSNPLPANRGQ